VNAFIGIWNRSSLLAHLLISTIMVGSAFAAEPDLQPRLEAQYEALKAAMAARDSNAIAALLTPDFVTVDSSNQSKDATKMIEETAALPVDPNKDSHTTLTNVNRNGDTAVVEQRYDMTTKRTGPDGSMQDIKLTTLSTDTWVNSNGFWRLKRSVTNQLDIAINGQTVIHKVRPN
jgi:ketosteroid isomerase-like protein